MPFQGLIGFGGGATSLGLVGAAGPSLEATGGTTSTPGDGYTYHYFTSSGSFVISSGETDLEYFVVAGGGGGGGHAGGGGGGAGGVRHNLPGIPNGDPRAYPVTPGTYTVSIGAAGAGAPPASSGPGRGPYPGDNSNFFKTPFSPPVEVAAYVRSNGGGGGAGGNPGLAGGCGGSGGGGTGFGPNAGGEGNVDSDCASNPGWPTVQGYDGGLSPTSKRGGGGGGAGAVGQDSPGSNAGNGGNGVALPSDMVPTDYGTPGPSPGRWFAGGGGGGVHVNAQAGSPGAGGGGAGAAYGDNGGNATANTGGGGGGCGGTDGSSAAQGGNGGTGFILVRYQ